MLHYATTLATNKHTYCTLHTNSTINQTPLSFPPTLLHSYTLNHTPHHTPHFLHTRPTTLPTTSISSPPRARQTLTPVSFIHPFATSIFLPFLNQTNKQTTNQPNPSLHMTPSNPTSRLLSNLTNKQITYCIHLLIFVAVLLPYTNHQNTQPTNQLPPQPALLQPHHTSAPSSHHIASHQLFLRHSLLPMFHCSMQRNATQHNATQRNATQHNTTQHNTTINQETYTPQVLCTNNSQKLLPN